LIELTRRDDDGSPRPTVADAFALEKLATAHSRGDPGHLAGKLVIQIR
jgi:hypothetical protein